MTNIETIMRCGFTLYEARVLYALHACGSATATELWKSCKVPKNKIYEILDYFGRQQITKLKPGKPKRYALINLQEVLKSRIEEKQGQLTSLEADIEKIGRTGPSDKVYEQTFWVMEGSTAMLDNVLENLQNIKEESIGFIDVWAARPANFKAVSKAIKRGVKFYFLGSIDSKTRPIAKEYAKLGVEIRHHPIRGAGYSIFDRKHVQLRLTEKKLILLSIESEQFASILRQHFFEIWENAKKIRF